MKTRSYPRTACFAVTGALSVLPVAAFADDTLSPSESLFALVPADEAGVPQPDVWRFNVGGGLFVMPTFPGASDSEVRAVPLIGASYGRFFVGANPDAGALLSLGAYLYRDSNWRAGVALSYDVIKPRDESDDDHLQGLGDVKRTAHAELFAVYTWHWLSVRGSVLTDIAGNDRGTVATLDAMGRYQATPQLTLTAGPGMSWTSSQYNRAYFGVDTGQSSRSGLPVYSPGSGVSTLRFSLGANYRIDRHWNVGATIVAAWLRGDAGDSPVTQKKNQMTYGLLASYRF